jgi:hypothetical protein
MSGEVPSARVRRFAFLALGALAVAGGGAWGISAVLGRGRPEPVRSGFEPPTQAELDAAARAERDLARAEARTLERATVLAPEEGRLDPASGEAVRRFQGFGLSVETAPPGATVRVNGQELGETPLVASVDCLPGQPVEVRVAAAGRREARRTTTCRANALVELRFELTR